MVVGILRRPAIVATITVLVIAGQLPASIGPSEAEYILRFHKASSALWPNAQPFSRNSKFTWWSGLSTHLHWFKFQSGRCKLWSKFEPYRSRLGEGRDCILVCMVVDKQTWLLDCWSVSISSIDQHRKQAQLINQPLQRSDQSLWLYCTYLNLRAEDHVNGLARVGCSEPHKSINRTAP